MGFTFDLEFLGRSLLNCMETHLWRRALHVAPSELYNIAVILIPLSLVYLRKSSLLTSYTSEAAYLAKS